MWIEKIKLRDFRNYPSLELSPHPGINLLLGQNGCGKTNLLEAVHYCALGRSHRTSLDREVVRKGAVMGACGVTLRRADGKSEIAVKLTPEEARKKQVFIDRKRANRLSDLMGHVQCVIFSPEDLLLVKEGPSVRRQYADMMLSQLSPGYFVALQQYQKALEQRNALLKMAMKQGRMPEDDMLDAFEEALAQASEIIIPMRRRLIDRVAAIAADKYAAISGRPNELFRMQYQCCIGDENNIRDAVRKGLRNSRREDSFHGHTGFGIHRENIALTLQGRDMKLFASQGQIRTAALCMKLSQLDLFKAETGETPILLLDDVMSELDMTRRTHLLREIEGVQTFVTCTDESDLDGCEDRRTYRVSLTEELCASISEKYAGEKIESNDSDDEEPDFT